MLLEHQGKSPVIHPTAYVAPNAVVCGDVHVSAHSSIMFGATVLAQGGSIHIGEHCVIMDQAVIRATAKHSAKIGNHVLIGPHAAVTGCTLGDNVFIATGGVVFNNAKVGARSEVRVYGVVHVNTTIAADTTVPIHWVAVGTPAKIFPPDQHDAIWAIQRELDFPSTVFNLERAPQGGTIMPELTKRYSRYLANHKQDRVLG